jgi:metal-sulfur cluster biosynthetic enzyme
MMDGLMDSPTLRAAILKKLSTVIDPETGVDVVRMRLIEDLTVDENGAVKYRFRPSSPLCPIAVPLANSIQMAVAEIPGVISQEIEVVDFILSDELMELLKRTLEDLKNEGRE